MLGHELLDESGRAGRSRSGAATAPFQWKFTRDDLHKLLAKTDTQPTSIAA